MDVFDISYGNIFEYVGDKKRCLKEGEAVFNAGHILACGVKTKTEEKIEISAFCAQTSSLREKPHELRVAVKKDGFKLVCSCKAGMSEMCKHCVAVLIYLNRNPPASLEPLSCTDTAQAWGKVKGREWYQGTPLADLCHVSENPHKIQPLTEEEEDKCKMILVGACPDSALALHGQRKRKLESPRVERKKDDFITKLIGRTCEPLYVCNDAYSDSFYLDVVAMAYGDSEELCRETTGQCSEQWRHARSVRITASVCYGLYTATSNWEEKFARTTNVKFSGCKATRFGTAHEPVARDMYAVQTGAKVRQCGLVVPPMMPWLACSPDGVVENGGSLKLLEIKCPVLCESVDLVSNVKSKNLPYLCLEGENLSLKKKHKYYAQVQLSMTLLDLETCDFVIYDKVQNTIHVLQIPRDEVFCRNLVQKLGMVFFDHVLPYLKRKGAH